MVTIVFESHGTTFDNEAELSSGLFDVALSPLGEQQAKELGERHKSEQFDAIFCSTLVRSYRTAEIAFAGRNIPVIKDARLNECDYGNLTRHPNTEVQSHRGEYIDKPFPGGESYAQTAARMRDFLRDLLAPYDGKKVLIIGHRATQYGLEHWLKGVPLKQAVTAPWSWQSGWVYQTSRT